IGSVGHYSHNVVHRRALHIEQFLDFHVSVPALLHEIAFVNDFAITLAFRANSSKKDELSWICNGDDFRELTLRPFVVIEILFLAMSYEQWKARLSRNRMQCAHCDQSAVLSMCSSPSSNYDHCVAASTIDCCSD